MIYGMSPLNLGSFNKGDYRQNRESYARALMQYAIKKYEQSRREMLIGHDTSASWYEHQADRIAHEAVSYFQSSRQISKGGFSS